MSEVMSAGSTSHYALPFLPTASILRDLRSDGYDVDANWTGANFDIDGSDGTDGSDGDGANGSDGTDGTDEE